MLATECRGTRGAGGEPSGGVGCVPCMSASCQADGCMLAANHRHTHRPNPASACGSSLQAHAPFTHTTTFAKGWPVPGETLKGNSDSIALCVAVPLTLQCGMLWPAGWCVRPARSAITQPAPLPLPQMWCASTRRGCWGDHGSPIQSTWSLGRPAWCSPRLVSDVLCRRRCHPCCCCAAAATAAVTAAASGSFVATCNLRKQVYWIVHAPQRTARSAAPRVPRPR